VKVRPAAAEDAPALAALEATLFGADAWSEAAVLDELVGPGRNAVVAVEGDEPVGYAVTMRAGDVLDLQRIGVAPAYQRRGVARALLDAVLEAATEEADRMLLEVSAHNAAALAFYDAADFVEIDRRRRYYRDGSDAVVMSRSLRRASHDGRG
jgi:ribosomal-protein-alanine N-acetyltransferase